MAPSGSQAVLPPIQVLKNPQNNQLQEDYKNNKIPDPFLQDHVSKHTLHTLAGEAEC